MLDIINILTTGRLGAQFQEAVKDQFSNSEINVDYYEKVDQQIINNYDKVACFSLPETLDISHLRWIHGFGAGVDAFIFHPNLNSATWVSRTGGLLGQKLAEYCLGYMLADHLNMMQNYTHQRQNIWQQGKITNLFKSSIAVLGTGEMSRALVGILNKLGCRIYGISRSGRKKAEFHECFKLEEFIANPPEIDTLISILPSTRSTAGILDKSFFRNLSNLHFINVGRGDVIEKNVLFELLASGKIRRATLDVFSSEPLSSDSDLWQHEKVIITPHQAAVTNIDDVMISFREALEAWKEGKKNNLYIDFKKQY